MTATRELWLDALRGFTMILVVMGHIARGLFSAGQITDPAYRLWDLVLYSLHVPLLFVLAGYTFGLALRRRPFLTDRAARLWRILHPYFVWTAITATAMFALAAVVNRPLGLSGYVRTLIAAPVLPYSIFWFLYVLAITQCLLAVAVERGGLRPGHVLALGAAGLVAHQILMAAAGPIEAFQITNILRYFFFLALGAWLEHRLARHPALPCGRIAAGLFLPVLMAWAAILTLGWGIDGPFGLATSTLATLAFMLAARAFEGRLPALLARRLAGLGLLSLEIYVMHVLFNGVTRIALNAAGIASIPVHMVLGTVIGTFGPVAAALLLQRIGLAPMLGLSAPPTVRPLAPGAVAG